MTAAQPRRRRPLLIVHIAASASLTGIAQATRSGWGLTRHWRITVKLGTHSPRRPTIRGAPCPTTA